MRIAWESAAIVGVLVAVGVASRLVEHPWNVAPVTAVAIVAGMELPLAHAIALPFAIRIISDAMIGFFAWPLLVAVYACHAFGAVIGRLVRNRSFVVRAIGAPTVSAIVFFLVTNFAFLYREYPHTFSGVLLAYANGLPFLRGTLLGDVGYTAVLAATITTVRAWKGYRSRALVAIGEE